MKLTLESMMASGGKAQSSQESNSATEQLKYNEMAPFHT